MVICRLSVPNQQQFHAPSLAAGRPFLALLAQQAVFLRDSYVGLAERPDPHLRRGPNFLRRRRPADFAQQLGGVANGAAVPLAHLFVWALGGQPQRVQSVDKAV